MNGWICDKKTGEFVNMLNGARTRVHPEIGEPDEYWMNSIESVVRRGSFFATNARSIQFLQGVNCHWPSVQRRIAKFYTGYNSFDPMI